jgi:geranylgeranyl transferase type-2 subunit alpha
MHGQKRNEYKMKLRDPDVAAGLAKKAQQWFQLSGMLVQTRTDDTAQHQQQQLVETLQMLSKLVLVNPDPMYLWNHRRDLLLQLTSGWEQPAEYFNNELTLTQQCLERNTKAYSVWFHRKWLITNHHHHHQQQQQSSAHASHVLDRELDLTSQFLQLDERNFHCWNYRRFVIGLCGDRIVGSSDSQDGGGGEWTWLRLLPTMTHVSSTMGRQVGTSTTSATTTTTMCTTPEQLEQLQALVESEWNFTTTKIHANFSNGSAFHYRSKLLPYRHIEVEPELELIHNAIFTEPDDQTAWWYLEYLLPFFSTSQLEEEKGLLQELVEDHPSKWVWLGLYNVLSRMEGKQEDASILNCLGQLMNLDVDRKARYESLKSAYGSGEVFS